MKKIAIDIDNTICDTTDYFGKVAERFDKEVLHKNNVINYNRAVPRSDEWTEEETSLFFKTEFINEQLNIPIKKDVSLYLNKIKELGYEIVFITTRGYGIDYDAEGITKEFFKKNNILYDKLLTRVLEKYEYLDGYDYFIDDFIKQCEGALNNSSCKVIMMSALSNKEYTNDRIKKVNNWKEIYEYIISNDKNEK